MKYTKEQRHAIANAAMALDSKGRESIEKANLWREKAKEAANGAGFRKTVVATVICAEQVRHWEVTARQYQEHANTLRAMLTAYMEEG